MDDGMKKLIEVQSANMLKAMRLGFEAGYNAAVTTLETFGGVKAAEVLKDMMPAIVNGPLSHAMREVVEKDPAFPRPLTQEELSKAQGIPPATRALIEQAEGLVKKGGQS